MADPTPGPDALDLRKGLPDALKVLLADYPREAWAADPGFHGLVSFWLDRHQMFRRLLSMMQADTAALRNRDIDPRQFSQRLSRLGGMFVQELHGHHQIEDHHYFPVLMQKEPAIARGFEILDSDHHALDGHLDGFVRGANGLVTALSDPIAAGSAAARFDSDLARFETFLDRHLTDEEDLIVPILLRHGERSLG